MIVHMYLHWISLLEVNQILSPSLLETQRLSHGQLLRPSYHYTVIAHLTVVHIYTILYKCMIVAAVMTQVPVTIHYKVKHAIHGIIILHL